MFSPLDWTLVYHRLPLAFCLAAPQNSVVVVLIYTLDWREALLLEYNVFLAQELYTCVIPLIHIT